MNTDDICLKSNDAQHHWELLAADEGSRVIRCEKCRKIRAEPQRQGRPSAAGPTLTTAP